LASDTLQYAVEIQNTCEEQNIPLKIGIHEGEMVFAGTDVLGDSVNDRFHLELNTMILIDIGKII